mgnify:CR=1 FL=1|tara:strand:+ start:2816 stop:3403 length:588 start_codon:yes stop_codon:yes gene_type:complete
MGWNADGTYKPDDEAIAPRVAELTSQDSPLMRQARTSGMAMGNRRGLINSSMAVGAAEGAALGVATPIASQESQQKYGKNVQFMQNQQQDKTTSATLASEEKRTADSLAADRYRTDTSIASDERKTAASIAAQDRQTVAQQSGDLARTYTDGIGQTLVNDKIPATTRSAAQRDISGLYQASLQRLQTVYGVNLGW